FLSEPHPVFVTIRNTAGQLRGCVGTLEPKFPNVAEETWRIARSAAFEDGRFEPVCEDELRDLRFDVSVLQPLEEVASELELDPTTYGVVLTTEDDRRGVLLPGLEEVVSVSQQLDIARRKGNILPHERVQLRRFRVTKISEQSD